MGRLRPGSQGPRLSYPIPSVVTIRVGKAHRNRRNRRDYQTMDYLNSD